MEGTYADIIIYDAKEGPIKRDDLHVISDSFEMTSVEPAGKLIYIINLIENVMPENVNALLKFLEEPTQEVYAFLTTENEARVLPTIVSRTQVLRFKDANLKEIVKNAESLEVPLEDAEILSHFYHNPDTIKSMMIDEDYVHIKKMVLDFLLLVPLHTNKARLYWLSNIVDTIDDKEKARFFIDLLTMFLEAVLKRAKGPSNDLTSYDKLLIALLEKLPNLETATIEIMLTRGQIELNVNLALLLQHVLTTLTLEEKE
jgi:DNA polymerase-3 subunit delta'